MTGYGQYLERALLGAVATLTKPFDLDALLAVVARYCTSDADADRGSVS